VAGHEFSLVLTQPDRPGGRGLKENQSAVKQHALALGAPVYQPETLKSNESLQRMLSSGAEAMIVAAYGLILPRSLLDAFPLGALNIHASLLPRWRGAAPIQRAILAGDRETGISIMRMDAGLDTGPVLAQRAIPILEDDDAGTLHDKLAELGARMMVEVLGKLAHGGLDATPQPADGATYAAKISKQEALIDWSRPASELARVVRAFRPHPGAMANLDDAPLKIWRARALPGRAVPGCLVVEGGRLVAGCGEGLLEIEELQRPGGRRLAAAEFLRGYRVAPEARFR
jgi:methionyl-tRNA formyltransferase